MNEAPLMAAKKVFGVGQWWGLVSKFVTKHCYVIYSAFEYSIFHTWLVSLLSVQMCGSLCK